MDAKSWSIAVLLFGFVAALALGHLVNEHNQNVIEKLQWQLEQKPKVITLHYPVEKLVNVPGDCEAGYEIRAEEQFIWIYKNNTPIYFYPRVFYDNQ